VFREGTFPERCIQERCISPEMSLPCSWRRQKQEREVRACSLGLGIHGRACRRMLIHPLGEGARAKATIQRLVILYPSLFVILYISVTILLELNSFDQ
jgi:hypothetical protein